MDFFTLILYILSGMAVVFSFIALFSLVIYFLGCYGLYSIAKNNGYENMAILAFIPIANIYLISMISGDIYIFNTYKIDKQYTVVVFIVLAALMFLPYIGNIAYFALLIVSIFLLMKFYNRISPHNATLLAIFSAIFPYVLFIFLLAKKDVLLLPENDGQMS